MESNLIRVFGEVAGLGGLSLGVFLLLFRELLRKGLFPRLTRIQSYRILNLFMLLTFLIAIIGIVAWVITVTGILSTKDAAVNIISENVEPIIVDNKKHDALTSTDLNSNLQFVLTKPETSGKAPYAAIDFKLLNKGDAAAVLWQFTVDVAEVQVDVSPILKFAYVEQDSDLIIKGTNNGWGSARNCVLALGGSYVDEIFSKNLRAFAGSIESGETKTLLMLHMRDADPEMLHTIDEAVEQRKTLLKKIKDSLTRKDKSILRHPLLLKYLSRTELFDLGMFFQNMGSIEVFRPQIPDAVPVLSLYKLGRLEDLSTWHGPPGTILSLGRDSWVANSSFNIVGHCTDERGKNHGIEAYVLSGNYGDLWISRSGFYFDRIDAQTMHAALKSLAAFVVVLDNVNVPFEKKYPMSIQIPARTAERFHVIVGATRSSTIRLRFKFNVNKEQIVTSEYANIHIWRPRDQYISNYIRDGIVLDRCNGVWQFSDKITGGCQ